MTGIDVTAEFCRAAELLTRLVGLTDRVTFRHADALDMPFSEGSFDAVWNSRGSVGHEQPGRTPRLVAT